MGPIGPTGLPMLPPHIDGGVSISDISSEGFGIGPKTEARGPSPFEKLLTETVESTNQSLLSADAQATDFAEGRSDDIHGTMIALTEADVQLRMVGTMKNKIVEAFYELWRMQI